MGTHYYAYNNNIHMNDCEKDMEEWDGDRYVGIGIKKMKAYKCNLKYTDLQKKRNMFWDLKTDNKNENYVNWSIIQRAVSLDEPRNIHYLQHFNIEPINGCINECKDKNGNIYHIPNYCINDPYFERETKDDDYQEIKNEIIDVKFYRYGNYEPFVLKVNNTISGKDLKEECRKHENLKENLNIRLFISGVEIKDEQYLYQHNITKEKPIYLIVK